MTLAIPMPEQTRPPDEKQLFNALVEYTAQRVELLVAKRVSTDA